MKAVTAAILTICIEIRGENRVLPFPNSVELNIEVCIYIHSELEGHMLKTKVSVREKISA